MVLLRKSCPFKLVSYKEVTNNCLSVKLEYASKQELEIAFVYNPNDEADKINNLSEALNQLSRNGCKNQLIIGDYNTSLNTELDYVDYTQDPLCGSNTKHLGSSYTAYKKMNFLLTCTDF